LAPESSDGSVCTDADVGEDECSSSAIVFLQASSVVVVRLGLQAGLGEALSLLNAPGPAGPSAACDESCDAALALPGINIALFLLAAPPVSRILRRKQLKTGGDSSYVHGLLATVTILSIALLS